MCFWSIRTSLKEVHRRRLRANQSLRTLIRASCTCEGSVCDVPVSRTVRRVGHGTERCDNHKAHGGQRTQAQQRMGTVLSMYIVYAANRQTAPPADSIVELAFASVGCRCYGGVIELDHMPTLNATRRVHRHLDAPAVCSVSAQVYTPCAMHIHASTRRDRQHSA